jgi:AAA15 family ATPase/GTPase
MELLYVWIEDYKNIHHQGFNFSPKYRFEFKSTEFETIKDKKGKPKLDKDQKELTSVKAGILKDQMSDKDRENFLLEYFFQPLQDIKNNSDNCKIKNITAIVGENGAGKSNLLEFIRKATNHLLRKDKNKNILRIRKTNFIFLIKDNEGKIYYFCSEGLKLGTNKEYQNGNNIENLIVIYYSNIFSLSDDNKEIVDFDKQSENKIFEVALTPQSYLSAVS